MGNAIRTSFASILSCWTDDARRAAGARGLDRPALQNLMPVFLTSIAEAGPELGAFTGSRRQHLETHFGSRLRQGFQLDEIVEEIALLGRCIAKSIEELPERARPSAVEFERLFSELHLASAAVARMFASHMDRDEQVEKRYQRLIQDLATASMHEGAAPFRDRLEQVLEVVMDAMGAESAALMLRDEADSALPVVAATGVGKDQLARYVGSLDPLSFAGRFASSGATTAIEDVQAAVEVPKELAASGLRSVLGVRLPPQRTLLGVMFVGATQVRTFSAREALRLESLGETLALHLENARLYAELHEQIDVLHAEQKLRERFVSVLAHDLRGPLGVVKMGTELLAKTPSLSAEHRQLAGSVERNVDRMDHMIGDLLDANRIRAGERLGVEVERCELGAIARDVAEELGATTGARFVVDAPEPIAGWWSAEQLRRAVWNLAANAAKYGAPGAPITIRLRKDADRIARVSVHNWGPPIAWEERARIFQPFARARSTQTTGQKGWGLGLLLVQGCADAHGGRLELRSSLDEGTTFTLALPEDARSAQIAPRARTPAEDGGAHRSTH